MGSTAALVSLNEYLNTTYEPDMEFVDGALVGRNVGTQLHSRLQKLLTVYFSRYEKSHRLEVFPEARLLVNAATGRHRIPDVMVVAIPYQKGSVVVDVPVIVVEIKSPGDTFDDIVGRCFDYEKLGVRNIVVMDPDSKRAWLFEQGNLRLLAGNSTTLNLASATIDFPFLKMLAELDQA